MAASKRKPKNSSEVSPSKQDLKSSRAPDEESESGDSVQENEGGEVPVQVNNASLSELKIALDDATKTYLNTKAGFTQSHKIEDIKLGLGWLSNVLAGGVSLAGWLLGWQKTQVYTGYCVGAYAVLSAILAVFATKVEKNIIYVGSRSSKNNQAVPEKVTISTEVKSYEPIYNIELVYETTKKAGPKTFKSTLKPHFKQFFDVDGYLDEQSWHKYLEKAVSGAISKS